MWGSVIGAGISSLGSIAGGALANKGSSGNIGDQLAYQREFAQNGVRWRVADAKAAGIHPLAALGAQTISYNPIAVSSNDYGVSEALGRMGQGIDRAIHAKALAEERALDSELKRAQIANVNAQTDAVRAQAAASQAAVAKTALPPVMPPANNSSQSPYWDKPIHEFGWIVNKKGQKIGVVPSEKLKERTEDVLGYEWIPFIKAGIQDFLGRFFGQEINDHFWHGEDVGYKPYPPRGHKRYTGGGGGA